MERKLIKEEVYLVVEREYREGDGYVIEYSVFHAGPILSDHRFDISNESRMSILINVKDAGKIKIHIYAEDKAKHHLPHVHAKFGDDASASIDFRSGEIIKGTQSGRIRSKDLKEANRIIEKYREKIIEEWNRANPNHPFT